MLLTMRQGAGHKVQHGLSGDDWESALLQGCESQNKRGGGGEAEEIFDARKKTNSRQGARESATIGSRFPAREHTKTANQQKRAKAAITRFSSHL